MSLFSQLLAKYAEVKAAFDAGDYKTLWRLEIELQQLVYNFCYPTGVMAGGSGNEWDKAACKAAHDELVSCCETALAQPALMAAGADPVGKLGDGKILELLLKILTIVGPWFI